MMQRWQGTSVARACAVAAAVAVAGAAGLCAGEAPVTGPAARPPLTPTTAKGRLTLPETPAHLAVSKGVSYLLAQQNRGTWEREPTRNGITHTGGETALVAWTLLYVGECLDEPALRAESDVMAPALAYLIRLTPATTYAAAMQGLALSRLPLASHDDARRAAEQARDYLLKAMQPAGGFTYTAQGKDKAAPDNANTAAAVHALAALEQAGVETPPAVWATLDEYWRARQHKDGGWAYDDAATARKQATPGMTAAAVASVHLTAAFRELKTVPPELPRDVAVANGLTFLAGEIRPESKDYYFLYHLQRAAAGAGLRALRQHALGPEIAGAVMRAQAGDGSWLAEFADPTIAGEQRLVSTCYALLALTAGMQPVALSKLAYDGEARWDARPRDVANLSMWFSGRLSRPMRWQVLSAATPAADDGAAPVLVITGAAVFSVTPELAARLRKFVDSGGVILSVAEPAPAGDATTRPAATLPSAAFTDAVMKNVAPTVLGGAAKFRELPPTHPLFDLWTKTSSTPPKVLAAGNGVREMWVHVPVDLSASWQGRKFANKDHFTLAMNLYSYATGKGDVTDVPLQTTSTTTAPDVSRAVGVARVVYGGNADPEPLAWARFARRAPGVFRTKVNLADVPIDKLDAATHPIAHLVGTGKVTWSDAEIAGLKKYVDAGGLLLIEAAGGDVDFGASAANVLPKLVPEGQLVTIPRNDLLYNGAMPDSAKLPEVEYRRFTTHLRPMEVAPRLRGLARGGRWAVVFSEDDLTAGLLGLPTWGIAGYAPGSAEALVRNLLLYSLKPVVNPTTGTAESQPARD